jgi:hypothetical protein
LEAALSVFRGRYFFYRGDYLVGDHEVPHHVAGDGRLFPETLLAFL